MADKMRSQDLGIDLSSGRDKELFKWLVACILFGHRIQQKIAADAFHELDKAGLTRPDKLRQAKWQEIVDALGRGHFVRYDESTATRLQDAAKVLEDRYNGSLRRLFQEAEGQQDVQQRLMEFKGIGKKAASIFLRDIDERELGGGKKAA